MGRGNVFLLIALLPLLFTACIKRDKSGKPLDTTTSGSITITVDESLKPIIDAEVNVFQSLYTKAHITIKYMSEADAIGTLLKDSVKLIIITRKLLPEESGVITSNNSVLHDISVAREGIALILNKNNPDSLIKMEELKGIIKGNISTWKQLNAKVNPANIELVFDHPHSGMMRFLNDSITPFEKLPSFCFALNNNPEVIDYVSKKKNAIGLIGMSWISDKDDQATNRFLSIVRVAGILNERDGEFYQPYQAYIAQKKYPLVREVFLITREARSGLASGFMSFIASDKGQRIILKAGLVPTTMPVRIVQINQDPLVIKK